MSWLKNKNVILTGVSTGIGKSMAEMLIQKYNCRVLGVARSVDKLVKLKEQLGDDSPITQWTLRQRNRGKNLRQR
jgi:short-subunit dehydrogenase